VTIASGLPRRFNADGPCRRCDGVTPSGVVASRSGAMPKLLLLSIAEPKTGNRRLPS